ncbi:30S ribosomal protein S2 [Candidatus Uhrbacteria bacterium]|nr:30S ribosomal protein S2 [Candidatus Uhrbacteria bacterium]
MPQLPTLVQLLESGLHFGHRRSRRHPKMEPFLFSTKNDLSVIDVRKTLSALEAALAAIVRIAEQGGTLLCVGTKKQAQAAVKKCAEETGQPYVVNRWLGGTLTNFSVISKMIKKYHSLKGRQASGELQKYTKKEQLEQTREIDELDTLIGGIQRLTALPDALFVVDINHDSTAVKEARKKHIPIIALCDANVNPELVTFPIPGNDDARKSIDLILRLVSESYQEGAAKRAAHKLEKSEPAQVVAAPTVLASGVTL